MYCINYFTYLTIPLYKVVYRKRTFFNKIYFVQKKKRINIKRITIIHYCNLQMLTYEKLCHLNDADYHQHTLEIILETLPPFYRMYLQFTIWRGTVVFSVSGSFHVWFLSIWNHAFTKANLAHWKHWRLLYVIKLKKLWRNVEKCEGKMVTNVCW